MARLAGSASNGSTKAAAIAAPASMAEGRLPGDDRRAPATDAAQQRKRSGSQKRWRDAQLAGSGSTSNTTATPSIAGLKGFSPSPPNSCLPSSSATAMPSASEPTTRRSAGSSSTSKARSRPRSGRPGIVATRSREAPKAARPVPGTQRDHGNNPNQPGAANRGGLDQHRGRQRDQQPRHALPDAE